MDAIVQYLNQLDSVTSWEEVFDITDALLQQETNDENQYYIDNDGPGRGLGDGVRCI